MTTTITPAPAASAATNVVAKTENVLATIGQYVPAVATIAATIPGAAPYVSIGLTVFNAITNAVNLIQAEQGKSFAQAFEDVIAHLTPGQPNSPVLS